MKNLFILIFDIKQKLKSKAGICSIPDGYVISLSKPFEWFVVEVEPSTHPLQKHITTQLNTFMIGVKNPNTQKELVETLFHEIDSNKHLRTDVEIMTGLSDIKGFLYDLIILQTPKIAVVIEQRGDKVQEACEGLKVEPTVIEFKTYVREDAPNVHAHLFEPLYALEKPFEKGKKEGKEYAERRFLRKKFWTGLLEKAKEKTDLYANISPSIYHYIGTGAGKAGIM